jgi:hypothetical protein
LQTPDSTFLEAALSNPDGSFVLRQQPAHYRLVVQHLAYITREIAGSGSDVGTVVLTLKDNQLEELVVTAARPMVKVEGGKLNYDIQTLAASGIVNNTYEALTKLPGLAEMQGVLTLAGAGSPTVILNGKPTSMDWTQLQTLLRNTPVERVERVEVMYSAPPQYHVRGAAVNVVLKRATDYSMQGEVRANYVNQYFGGGNLGGNLRLSTPRAALDVMYSADAVRSMQYLEQRSHHTLGGTVHDIDQTQKLSGKYVEHNVRAAAEYNVSETSNLQIAYTGSFSPNETANSHTTGNFQTSDNDKDGYTRMHNLSLQYRLDGLDLGADYTRYRAGNNQKLRVVYADGRASALDIADGQQIDRYSVYADRSRALSRGWTLDYGASYQSARDRDYQTYANTSGDFPVQDTHSDLREQTTDFYLGLTKQYATGASFMLSATGEYYTFGDYEKWTIYPQASLTYLFTPSHIFQLSLSTDKTYPNYWDMQSAVSYIDGYAEILGTPGLRPMTEYSLNANYIWKQRYIFGAFLTHTDNYFMQSPYQATDRLALIYKTMNWNYMQNIGVNVILPFSAGDWLRSQLTAVGMQVRDRGDDFFDLPFDRKHLVFISMLNNSLTLPKRLTVELNARLQTPTVQGTFDLNTVFSLNAGIKWRFAGDKASLSLQCNDLFNSGFPKTTVDFKGQNLTMDATRYSRSVSLGFVYSFGGYKQRETKDVDTSRFGH